ncbi:MAG: hypothetical protein HC848_00680 [Limnobacter sp.]|nr:hypothetical protein [Limnobacter sp.]
MLEGTRVVAEGAGHSRRLAEQQAAERALAQLLEADFSDPNHTRTRRS